MQTCQFLCLYVGPVWNMSKHKMIPFQRRHALGRIFPVGLKLTRLGNAFFSRKTNVLLEVMKVHQPLTCSPNGVLGLLPLRISLDRLWSSVSKANMV